MAEDAKPPTYEDLVEACAALRAENGRLKSRAARLEADLRLRNADVDRLRQAKRPAAPKLDPKSGDPFRRPWTGR